ncbi:MAG: tyrosine-type recombinase/integrase [Bacteroidales bacterium]|nr:tyrosine-type recombinase/integrase [Bacteroidales bacterium]
MIPKLTSNIFLSDHINKQGLSKLYLQITISRKVKRYPLQIFIEPENWNNKVIKRPDKDIMNRIITNEISKVNSIYLKMMETGKVDFSIFEKYYYNIDNTKISEIINLHCKTIQKDSRKVFETVRKNLETLFGDISICEIDYNKVCRFHKHIEHLSHNTIWVRHKVLRTIINTAIKHEIYKETNPYKIFKWTYRQPIRLNLTKQEQVKIEALRNKPGITDRIKCTAEAFLFCCYTGLRFSDIKQLRSDHIQTNAIVLEQEKTDDIVYIPLNNKAKNILQNRNSYFIFDLPSNQKYNEALKDLATSAGISKNLTSHIARHTFAVLSIEKNIPLEVISKLLGHRDIKTTQIYAQIKNPVLDKYMQNWNK